MDLNLFAWLFNHFSLSTNQHQPSDIISQQYFFSQQINTLHQPSSNRIGCGMVGTGSTRGGINFLCRPFLTIAVMEA
jgi:hypothetical protein